MGYAREVGMEYEEFKTRVKAAGFTLKQLRGEEPYPPALVEFAEEVDEPFWYLSTYERYVMRLEEEATSGVQR